MGYIPVVMDFERSLIVNQHTSTKLVYDDIRRVLNLAGSEFDVKTNIDNTILNKYIENNTPITYKVYTDLCVYIDSIYIKYVSSDHVRELF